MSIFKNIWKCDRSLYQHFFFTNWVTFFTIILICRNDIVILKKKTKLYHRMIGTSAYLIHLNFKYSWLLDDRQTFATLMSKFLVVKNIVWLTEPVIVLQYWHYSNVSMNSVYVEKFISNIVKNAKVRLICDFYKWRTQ